MKTALIVSLLLASLAGTASANEQVCIPNEDGKNCKKGDVLTVHKANARYFCDFKHPLYQVTDTVVHCLYIGYVRKDSK